MYFDVASVVANDDFTLSLVFEDGKSGIYDMKPLIGKGPWEHLASLSFFKTVSIDCGTAVWPGYRYRSGGAVRELHRLDEFR